MEAYQHLSPLVESFYDHGIQIECDWKCFITMTSIFSLYVWHMIQMAMFGTWADGNPGLIWLTFYTTLLALNNGLQVFAPWPYWKQGFFGVRLTFFITSCIDIINWLALIL